MKSIVSFLLFVLVCTSGMALPNTTINSDSAKIKPENATITDSIAKAKSLKGIKCLMMASAGLHNVIVDHYKDAIRILSANPNYEDAILYQPDTHAPEDYIKMVEKNLFISDIWKSMENRIMTLGEEDFYKKIMQAYDNSGMLSVVGQLPTKEKWMNLFIIPNFRAVYINNIYWESEWNGPRIEESDIPQIIKALENYIKK